MREPLWFARQTTQIALFCAGIVSVQAAPHGIGTAEVGTNVAHQNGNVYDQLLLTAASDTVRADPGQVTRVSFVDLDEDILQVELSGAGALTLSLDNATGPARAIKYNQPAVLYMRGHARLRIEGSDATTNISIYSVGPATAVNQAIIKPGETYDGVADIAELEIVPDPTNPNGSTFGSIYAGNVSFWAYSGRTGIYAPNIQVQNLVRIADLLAFDTASPALVFGPHSQFGALQVTTGTLVQPNERLIQVGNYRFEIWDLSDDGVTEFAPSTPFTPGPFWLLGHDGTPLLWIVPRKTS